MSRAQRPALVHGSARDSREARMHECDRCPAYAVVTWWHPIDKRELSCCQHHSNEWAPLLLEQGWLIRARPALPALSSDPSTH